jgi:hypothetical protein
VCVFVCGIYLAQNGAIVNTIIKFGVEVAAVLLTHVASQGGGLCS